MPLSVRTSDTFNFSLSRLASRVLQTLYSADLLPCSALDIESRQALHMHDSALLLVAAHVHDITSGCVAEPCQSWHALFHAAPIHTADAVEPRCNGVNRGVDSAHPHVGT